MSDIFDQANEDNPWGDSVSIDVPTQPRTNAQFNRSPDLDPADMTDDEIFGTGKPKRPKSESEDGIGEDGKNNNENPLDKFDKLLYGDKDERGGGSGNPSPNDEAGNDAQNPDPARTHELISNYMKHAGYGEDFDLAKLSAEAEESGDPSIVNKAILKLQTEGVAHSLSIMQQLMKQQFNALMPQIEEIARGTHSKMTDTQKLFAAAGISEKSSAAAPLTQIYNQMRSNGVEADEARKKSIEFFKTMANSFKDDSNDMGESKGSQNKNESGGTRRTQFDSDWLTG